MILDKLMQVLGSVSERTNQDVEAKMALGCRDVRLLREEEFELPKRLAVAIGPVV